MTISKASPRNVDQSSSLDNSFPIPYVTPFDDVDDGNANDI